MDVSISQEEETTTPQTGEVQDEYGYETKQSNDNGDEATDEADEEENMADGMDMIEEVAAAIEEDYLQRERPDLPEEEYDYRRRGSKASVAELATLSLGDIANK